MFAFFSILALLSGAGVVLFRRPLYGALALCLSLFSLSILFYLMHAPLAALLEVLVYLGAIMTLFLFVIMMVAHEKESVLLHPDLLFVAAVLVASLFLSLVPILLHPATFQGNFALAQLAKVLYTEYLLPFEAASVLLLVSVIGVVYFLRVK